MSPPDDGASWSRWDLFALVAATVGAGLRIRQFVVDRSLWLDEALLARNVVERDLGGLLEPLSGQQGAPVGYLWVVRAVIVAFEPSERWMRLPSLIAGLAVVALAWAVGRRLFSRRTAAVATALVAVSPGLIRYSTELKQYSLDAAVALGLVLLAARAGDRPGPAASAVLAVAGAVAVWLSHPAVFVLAGIGAVLLVGALRRRDRAGIGQLAAVGALWAASAGILYWVSLRELTENDFLTAYWQAGFPDDPARPQRLLSWFWTSSVDLLETLGGIDLAVVALVLVLTAVVAAVLRRQGGSVALLFASVPALVVAASLEQYPFRGRLALFLLPPTLVALASMIELRPRALRVLAAGALMVVAVGPVRDSIDEARSPTSFPESRPVLHHLAERIEPGDRIYVHGPAEAPFAFYGPRLGLVADGVTHWVPQDGCTGPGDFVDQGGRAWIVFAYTHSAMPQDEAAVLRSQLDAVGRRLDLAEGDDAFVARYDFDAPPTDPTGASVRATPTTGCLRISGG